MLESQPARRSCQNGKGKRVVQLSTPTCEHLAHTPAAGNDVRRQAPTDPETTMTHKEERTERQITKRWSAARLPKRLADKMRQNKIVFGPGPKSIPSQTSAYKDIPDRIIQTTHRCRSAPLESHWISPAQPSLRFPSESAKHL